MPIGVHVRVAGGYANAVDYAHSVGCECLQVFGKSPLQWKARAMDSGVADAFRLRLAETRMGPVLVHTAYLINLGSEIESLWQRSIEALADEMMSVIVETATDYAMPGAMKGVEIVASKLGDNAGITGAAVLAKRESK